MENHSFLLEKLMRLILWHNDPIEELETLIARAYREKRIEQLTDPYSMVASDLED